jgi:hypothetical protein
MMPGSPGHLLMGPEVPSMRKNDFGTGEGNHDYFFASASARCRDDISEALCAGGTGVGHRLAAKPNQ